MANLRLDRAALFEAEYERIRRDAYRGGLPEWPGAKRTRGWLTLAATNWWWGTDPPTLLPFSISDKTRTESLVRELARHETAHVAALLFDGDHDHGSAWRRHALRCGARPHEIVLPNEWP